jgi:hypothetical protein
VPKIYDLDFDQYCHECVSIDRTDLNNEFCRVSADLAYWGERAAQAERSVGEAEIELEVIKAEAYVFQRNLLDSRLAKRASEDMVTNAVASTSKYRGAKEHLVDCKSVKRRIAGIIESVKTKRDMLVSLGAQLRSEQYEPQINYRRSSE